MVILYYLGLLVRSQVNLAFTQVDHQISLIFITATDPQKDIFLKLFTRYIGTETNSFMTWFIIIF